MELNQLEIEYVRSQVRQDLRRQDKKKQSLLKKFGDLADLTSNIDKTEWLENFYTKLGGKVSQISNRRKN